MKRMGKPSCVVWVGVLVLVLAIDGGLLVFSPRVEVVHSTNVHAQSEETNWTGSRFRCVNCHTHHQHEIGMSHPLNPTCITCHSGSPTAVGCPTCHSVHTIDYNHEVYTTCDECHSGEEVALATVHSNTTGYLAFVFSRSDMFLYDLSGLMNDYQP
jgi:hypothetical protein